MSLRQKVNPTSPTGPAVNMRVSLLLASSGVLLLMLFAGCSGGDKGTNGAQESPPCSITDAAQVTRATATNPVAVWHTSMGCFAVELYKEKTPITVGNFVNLTNQGFYDGTRFHRVIKDFMNQDGDPNSKDPAKKAQWGQGGPGYSIKDEFPCADGTTSYDLPAKCDAHRGLVYKFTGSGILAMANTGRPMTGGSQYFVTAAATPHLDGKHTIFGKVVAGLDVVMSINHVVTDTQDHPLDDVIIQGIKIL